MSNSSSLSDPSIVSTSQSIKPKSEVKIIRIVDSAKRIKFIEDFAAPPRLMMLNFSDLVHQTPFQMDKEKPIRRRGQKALTVNMTPIKTELENMYNKLAEDGSKTSLNSSPKIKRVNFSDYTLEHSPPSESPKSSCRSALKPGNISRFAQKAQ